NSRPCVQRCSITSFLFLCHPVPPTPTNSPLSLHDALPISVDGRAGGVPDPARRQHGAISGAITADVAGRSSGRGRAWRGRMSSLDRKSTRLNSSHVKISYAVFCLKKKKTKDNYYE